MCNRKNVNGLDLKRAITGVADEPIPFPHLTLHDGKTSCALKSDVAVYDTERHLHRAKYTVPFRRFF